jgi:uncharacterized tellurite resistance protein B-like protein
MNISFLPKKIRSALDAELAEKTPISIVRSSSTIDGDSGESYMLSFEDRLLIFSRKLGENDYAVTSDMFGNIARLELKNEGMNTLLNASLGGKSYSLKFSSFEEKNLKNVLDAWTKAGGGSASDVEEIKIVEESADSCSTHPKSATTSELSPLEGLAAALMFISAIDNNISDAEDQYITTLFAKNRPILKSALAYYKRHTFEDLTSELKKRLTNDQKLCYLANLLELAMKDMILHTSEQNIISHFIDEMEISQQESDTIRQVLLIKNRISALDA